MGKELKLPSITALTPLIQALPHIVNKRIYKVQIGNGLGIPGRKQGVERGRWTLSYSAAGCSSVTA
jgi:hypothetical protein